MDLLLECPGQSQQDYILGKPREALSQLKGGVLSARDPRLSEAGNQVWKRVGMLLDLATRQMLWADWPSGTIREAPMTPSKKIFIRRSRVGEIFFFPRKGIFMVFR